MSRYVHIRTLSHSKVTCVCACLKWAHPRGSARSFAHSPPRTPAPAQSRRRIQRCARRCLRTRCTPVRSKEKREDRDGMREHKPTDEWQEGHSRVRAPQLRSLRHTHTRACTPDTVRTEMRRRPAQRERQRLRPPARDLPPKSMGRPPAFERTTPCRSAARSPAREGCACRDGVRKGRPYVAQRVRRRKEGVTSRDPAVRILAASTPDLSRARSDTFAPAGHAVHRHQRRRTCGGGE